jgi:hypothetical protein
MVPGTYLQIATILCVSTILSTAQDNTSPTEKTLDTICPRIGCDSYGSDICAQIVNGEVKINTDHSCGSGKDCSIVSLYTFIYDYVVGTRNDTTLLCSSDYIVNFSDIDTEDDKIGCEETRPINQIFKE